SSPDMLLGWDSDPALRNIAGLAAKFPDLAKRGIRLRQFGQEICGRITGKKIHAMGIVPGGILFPLKAEDRKDLLAWIPEVTKTTEMAIEIIKGYMQEHEKEIDGFAHFETGHMGTVGPNGEHELYDGRIRLIDSHGKVLQDQFDPLNYLDIIAERPLAWSYLKAPYYKPMGFPNGSYRVGPLARLNVATKMKTPGAQKEFEIFKKMRPAPINGSFYFHYARLIEVLACIEEIHQILDDESILSTETLATAPRNQERGVGCTEAPRGILFHDYRVDKDGKILKANLLIATGQNNLAMNRSVLEVAKQVVRKGAASEGALNRIEGAIRCYDPCLSCSTHALGQMPIQLEILDAQGNLLQRLARSSG
ncbi:MAG TPA: Ni/Fe hydrogenase subunit alpha, partial [Candidatus Omnitrophota bacterium]|nr:Ni/Fe hydrogenase subunit alpha [Candidatus Omnitrophota bacterium]